MENYMVNFNKTIKEIYPIEKIIDSPEIENNNPATIDDRACPCNAQVGHHNWCPLGDGNYD